METTNPTTEKVDAIFADLDLMAEVVADLHPGHDVLMQAGGTLWAMTPSGPTQIAVPSRDAVLAFVQKGGAK